MAFTPGTTAWCSTESASWATSESTAETSTESTTETTAARTASIASASTTTSTATLAVGLVATVIAGLWRATLSLIVIAAACTTTTNITRFVTSVSTASSTTSSVATLFIFLFIALSFTSFTTGTAVRLTTSAPTTTPAESSPPAICCVGRSLYRGSLGPGHVASLIPLLSDYNVKLNHLSVSDRSHCLLRVVLDDGGLMDEDIFLRIIPIDETVTRLDVEPFHGSRDLGGYHLLHHLLFNLLLLPFPRLLLVWLGLRVSHDGNVVLMLTNFCPRLSLRWR